MTVITLLFLFTVILYLLCIYVPSKVFSTMGVECHKVETFITVGSLCLCVLYAITLVNVREFLFPPFILPDFLKSEFVDLSLFYAPFSFVDNFVSQGFLKILLDLVLFVATTISLFFFVKALLVYVQSVQKVSVILFFLAFAWVAMFNLSGNKPSYFKLDTSPSKDFAHIAKTMCPITNTMVYKVTKTNIGAYIATEVFCLEQYSNKSFLPQHGLTFAIEPKDLSTEVLFDKIYYSHDEKLEFLLYAGKDQLNEPSVFLVSYDDRELYQLDYKDFSLDVGDVVAFTKQALKSKFNDKAIPKNESVSKHDPFSLKENSELWKSKNIAQ